MFKVFVYGTLKKGRKLYAPTGNLPISIKEDTLSNYSIYVHKRAPFPFLKKDEGGEAHGEVHTYKDDRVLQALDYIEGPLYERVRVVTDEGAACFVYVFKGDVNWMKKIKEAW